MAVAVRLRRTGARNNARFRVVAADKRSPRDGRFIENLGWYDPSRTENKFELKLDRIEHWANNGAEVSDTVKSLVKEAKNPSAPKARVKKLAREKAEKAAADAKAAAEAPAKEAAPEAAEEAPAAEEKAEEAAPAEEAPAEEKAE